MDASDFQRARSPEAKQQREVAILAGARSLGAKRGIRQITLTDIADAVGMHKSAMLRYFETREQIFLRLTAEDWREWSEVLRAKLERIGSPTAKSVASAFSTTLADRGMFCDLLAQAPLNLERNVSLEAVRESSSSPTTKSTQSSRSCDGSCPASPNETASTSSPPRPRCPAPSGRWPTQLQK